MFVKCRRPPTLRDAQLSLGGQSWHLIPTAGTTEVGEGGREGRSFHSDTGGTGSASSQGGKQYMKYRLYDVVNSEAPLCCPSAGN